MSKPNKLFLLTRLGKTSYNETIGHVIRAVDETSARALADTRCSDEGCIWHNPDLVKCMEIPIRGKAEIILTSFQSA